MSETNIEIAKDFRHNLHKHPEISGKEVETTQRIKAVLSKVEHGEVIEFQQTGLLAKFSGQSNGPVILIRGDIDALPIADKINKPYKSIYKNIGHKCGHDGHSAILYQLALLLNNNFPGGGTVYLLFQPSEENGRGAASILNDSAFNIRPDYAFALHNLPGYNEGEVLLNYGIFSSSVISCNIKLQGKSAHAASPQTGISPIPFIQDLLLKTKSEEILDTDADNYFLCTPIHIKVGEKNYGVSPHLGEIDFTLRCYNNRLLDQKKTWFTGLIENLRKKYKLSISVSWLEEFRSVENDPDAVKIVKDSAEQMGLSVTDLQKPFTWGEDFGLFTEKFTGAMFGLGAGKTSAPLHDPEYDFNDALIEHGSSLFFQIIKNICT